MYKRVYEIIEMYPFFILQVVFLVVIAKQNPRCKKARPSRKHQLVILIIRSTKKGDNLVEAMAKAKLKLLYISENSVST